MGGAGRERRWGGTRSRAVAGLLPTLPSLMFALLAPAALASPGSPGSGPLSLSERAGEAFRALPLLDIQHAAAAALVLGLGGVSAAAGWLLARARRRAAARERRLTAEIRALRENAERAALLLGSERQLLVTWHGREGEPRIEGDSSLAGDGASARRALAFGAWLEPADAASVEGALDRLRRDGEAFALTARTLAGGFVGAEGRAVGGRAILRLRDVTGSHADFLRAREGLAAAERERDALKALVDAVPHPVWLRDAAGELAFANQAYLQAAEAGSPAEARGRALDLLDAAARAEAARREAAGEPYRGRVSAIVAGRRHRLDVIERPCAGGRAGMAVDVSEQEALRAELKREMEAHVRTLDGLSTAVAVFDGAQRLVFHNAAYRRLWGLDPAFLDAGPSDGEVLDRLRASRKLPEQADFRAWKAEALQAYRQAEVREAWWHLPDRRTLRVVTNPNPQGGVTYLFDDVSERFHLESQVTALTQVQSETLEALKEGVAVFGTDGRLKFHNRAFALMWDLAPADLAERPHVDAVVKACRPLTRDDEPWFEIRGAVAGLSDLRTGLSMRLDLGDGSVLDCAAEPLPDGATLLTFIDMSASVKEERALTERNEALERASRLRDEFVHHVSYELRSPLTNVIGFSQLLDEGTVGPLNPRQREYVDHIMRSSSSLLAILNDILDLASIDTGALELAPESVDIRATVEAALSGLEDRRAEADIKVEIQVPPDAGSFTADAKRIRQILFNLLSNAIGFSAPGQTVRVSVRRLTDEVVFEVADNGRGIPEEVQARVFERFESHAMGTRHRGVGLGLSIVRSFVELHGGRIELVSAPGRGTRVTCIFPTGGAPVRMAAE